MEQRPFSDSINFLFLFEKTAEPNRLIREAYGEHAPSQDTCEWWFRCFNSGDFEVADKEHAKLPKKTKVWNCKHYWTQMIRKHKNKLPSNMILVNKLSPIGYEK